MKIIKTVILSYALLLTIGNYAFADTKDINAIIGTEEIYSEKKLGKELIRNSYFLCRCPALTAVILPGTGENNDNGRIALHYDPYWSMKGIIAGGIGIGIGLEIVFLPFLSAKINSMYIGLPQNLFGINFVLSIINVSGGLRGYYLATGANGPFIGVCGGVFLVAANISGYVVTVPVIPMFMGETGYKWNFMHGRGFFLEPSIGYILTDPIVDISNNIPLGGLYVTINAGWVF